MSAFFLRGAPARMGARVAGAPVRLRFISLRQVPKPALALWLALFSQTADAHSFGRMYNLPVPFWMYIYGATGALLLSFLIVGYFAGAPTATASTASRDISQASWLRGLRCMRMLQVLKFLSVCLLLLCIATGLFGNRDPYRNFSMTFFWVVFVLGFAYLTALIGDLYSAINPWRVIAEGIERAKTGFCAGRLRYPAALAYWPALVLYMAFIWIELLGHTRPFSLGVMLAGYSAITLGGIWLFGRDSWLRYGEFFSVFLRLLAKMAPLDYRPGHGLRLRMPFAGLLQEPAEHYSLVLFVLFMLSSTAFDGLSMTVPWLQLFWADPFNIIKPWVGTHPVYAYARLRSVYVAWQTLCLLLSPFVYLAIYLFFVYLAKLVTRNSSRLSLYELGLRFALTLLPIVLVYNVTHYFTLILTQGVKIVSLFSDPFGWGWNLFGTLHKFRAPFLPDMGWVWHTQVGLILFGHIVSVYLAHVEALRIFSDRRAAGRSQFPMLILMVLFTGFGLWILAQPITTGR